MKGLGCKIVIVLLGLMASVSVVAGQSKLDVEIVRAVQESKMSDVSQWLAGGGDIDGVTTNANTLLIVASKVGDPKMIAYLLEQQAGVNIQNNMGSTALMIAAKYGHAAIVDLLLEHGADPTIRNKNFITAARFAWAYNHVDIYRKLQRAEIVFRRNS